MKKVELKVETIIENGSDSKLDYRQQIMLALRSPKNPNGGVDFEEMSRVLPIIEKVQDAGDYVLLEDAEFDELAARLKASRFAVTHEALFTMIKSIIYSPEYPVQEAAVS